MRAPHRHLGGSLTFPGQCEDRNGLGIRCQRKSGHQGQHEAHHKASDASYLWWHNESERHEHRR